MDMKDKSKEFDLMKDKPQLDYDTLNFVWDILWRFNETTKPTNNDSRSRIYERNNIMNYIQELANEI
jgi:hypothetical protein